MLSLRSLFFSLLTIFLFFSSISFAFSLAEESHFPTFQTVSTSGEKSLLLHFFGFFWAEFICYSFSLRIFLDKFSGAFGDDNYGLVGSWGTKRFLDETLDASEEPPLNSSLILAAKRTKRKDPLDGFKKYTGGWNISNKHYWAVSSQILNNRITSLVVFLEFQPFYL